MMPIFFSTGCLRALISLNRKCLLSSRLQTMLTVASKTMTGTKLDLYKYLNHSKTNTKCTRLMHRFSEYIKFKTAN